MAPKGSAPRLSLVGVRTIMLAISTRVRLVLSSCAYYSVIMKSFGPIKWLSAQPPYCCLHCRWCFMMLSPPLDDGIEEDVAWGPTALRTSCDI